MRTTPCNPDAEAEVLGALLIDGSAVEAVMAELVPDDFYIAANRTIFEAMRTLHQRPDAQINLITVADELELMGKLDEVGSAAYLSELAEGVLSAANAEHCARLVKRDSLIRNVIKVGNDIVKLGYESTDGMQALAEAEKLVYRISEDNSATSLAQVKPAAARTMNKILSEQQGEENERAIKTGFPLFDRKTRGLKPGEMVLIAARPSVGKTAFALNIAANVALDPEHPRNVAIFSLEMSDELLLRRMFSYVSGVSLSKMGLKSGLSDAESRRLTEAYQSISSSGLYIDDYSMNGPQDVLSKCRRLKHDKGLDLIIIDYLQLMTTTGAGGRAPESRQVEVSDMSRKMKIYAKELDCPIILLSQMSRGIEQRQDHKPMLSDLRESGSIEQDADIVAFLYKPGQYNAALPLDEVVLDVKKNRNGPIGAIMLKWRGDLTAFNDVRDIDDEKPEDSEKREKGTVEKIRDSIVLKSELQEVGGGDMPFEVDSDSAESDNVKAYETNYSAIENDSPDREAASDDMDDEYEYDDDLNDDGDDGGDLPF